MVVGETHHFRKPARLPIIEFSGDFFRSFLCVFLRFFFWMEVVKFGNWDGWNAA